MLAYITRVVVTWIPVSIAIKVFKGREAGIGTFGRWTHGISLNVSLADARNTFRGIVAKFYNVYLGW